ncbi:hypothetical protein GCM10010411_64600 [Actinomadura fulvescens]|uniref:Guanylate cyclase domain-containing protein n=2 Tax=Actinomadura fulvescens TaxID=46160 RepID=A0ABP6CJC6_9ACTN
MHKPLSAVDIVAFGDSRRDTGLQIQLRERMYQLLDKALTITGMSLEACHHEDRGDGAFIVAPADAEPSHLMDPLAHHLNALLRRENRFAPPHLRLRLRAAAHHGNVEHDQHGIAGRAAIDLFRHLEAPAFKRLMHSNPDADLGLVVTDHLFREAAQRGDLVNHDAYRPIRVTVKETRTRAWVWLPPPTQQRPTAVTAAPSPL